MHLTVFWGFALLLWSHGAVSQGRKECQPGQVHCQDTGSCVPRFEFRCGNRGCGGNKTLCGPPSGHPLECAPGNGCPDRSGSLPSGEGDIDGAVRQCSPGQVHCQASGACVPRFEFQCGNRVCGVNKSLCGPPSGDPLDCAPGKECPGRNGSLPSGEGDKDGEVNQDRMECPHGQVHCQSSGACVPRFEFQCGNRGCGVNKSLCGPPSGDPLDCALGKGCHDRNGSLPSGEGDKDGNNYYPEDDGVRSHMPREDSNDDNPFLSRWFQRGEHDFDRSDLRRVLNDTGLRRMLRQSFNRSIFKEINDHGSLDDRDDPHRDGCDKRYTPCIKNALKNVMLLKALDGQCCRMRENPLRFTLGLRNFTRQFHCSRGTKFCPFRFVIRGNGCIPVERNCSARLGNRSDDRNPSEPHWTPWGSKSRKGYKYCEIFKANIPDKMPCSYPVLIKWMAARNDSVSPFGKACPRGTRFCASTFDCRPKEKGCGTEGLIRWASKILCGSSQRLCVKCGIHCRLKEERCPREANMSMAMREAALKLEPREIGDEVLRNLTKSGWAPFCLLRKILLDRVLKELKQCMSREAHCRENGYEEHKNCVAGEEFCQKLVSFVRPFSTGSHHRCHGLKTDPVKFEEKIRSNWTKKPWGGECRNGHVFCPTSMRCVPKDRLSECTVDEQFCKAGLARPPWKMNHSKEAGGRFCCLFMSSAPNGSCSFRVMLDWLSRKDKSCSPFGQCCPGSQNFSLSQMRCVNPEERGNRKLDANDTKCEDDDHVFCERLHVCLPKHANCTKPERFNFFSVSKFANQSGWAALCQVLVPFNARLDYGLRKCRQFLNRPNGTCRGKLSCSEREEFCRRVGRCVPKGNCSNRPKPTDHSPPTPTPATSHSPLCNPMDPELRMLWAREPLRRLFAPNQEVPGLVGLLPPREVGAELQFKLQQGDWKDFKGCGRGQMRIVSLESTLRLSSCAHGFVSFDITFSPDDSAHGQCVNIPDSPQFKETVAMALLPNLDHCAAGLDIAVTRRNITTKEDRPSNTKLFSSYVNVTRNPMNCSVLDVEESLSCRISKAFRLRYRQAVRQLERTALGVVAVGTDPPKSVQLKCFTPQGRLVGIPPGWFLRTDLICGFHPALNAVGRVTVTVAPACKAPAPQAPNFDAVIQEDFRKIYEIFKSLPDLVKNGDPERIIGEIVRLLNAASDAMLKRKIRNFVRSFFEPDRKESCRAPDNCDCSIGTKEAKLNVVIRPVNDRPTLHFARYQNVIFFPPVPENASDIEGKCIDVSVLTKTSQTVIHEYIRGRRGGELFKRMAAGEVLGLGRDPPLVKDADNKRVGLAIREAPDHPKFGVWKYKLSGDGVLRTMNISSGWALLLKPGDCITFCATRGVFWGKETSRDLAFIKVRGWDCSNNLTSGYHRLNDSFMDSQTAFSLDAAKCVVLKLGCDNVAGSELERDRCGLCLTRERDRNKCVGCDGIAYSNKKKDECGNCVGRGEKSPYCSRSCRKPSYFDECGVCQINGSETPTTRDCNGDCHGSAKRSCNNICVGGKTGRPLNLGEDLCGKCGGKNECVDCAGEIHGKKRLDSCQRCLDPEDQLFNRCPKIIDVDVRAVIGNESTKLCVTVAGMKDSITCYLEGGDGSRYTLNFIEAKSKRKVILATPVGIPPGEYALNCTLDDIPNKIGFKEKIIVYRKPRIIEVSPNETMINTATNVTLTGEKFFNTAALQCVFFMENGKFLKVKATFVSAITIVCPLPPHARSQHGFISVMFNAKSEDLAKAMKRRFSIYELVPEPTSCKFSEKRNYLEILFSRPVECGNRKWESCSRYFNAVARSNLTEVSKCRCREGKLLVQVASGSRLRPGQTVGVLLRTIKPLRWGYTKYPSEEEQLIVQDSANPVEFTIKLSAPEEVGLCDSFTVSVETNQRAAMNWSAAFDNPSSATPAQSADLEQLNDRLANVSSKQRRVRFSARDFEVGVLYNITVCGVEEFSGQEDCDTVAIRRVGKTVPKIIFPASRIVIGPSIRVKFRAKVQPPSCVARNKRFMVYLWSCDVKGLEFDDENPSLRIGADQLTAGQVLKCTFTAYIRGDDSLRARAKLTIVVKKKNVVAKIKGGQQRTIGAHEEAVCDGGVSYDPNNLAGDPIYLWTCECKYDDGWKSCIHRNKTTGHLKAVILPNERVVRIPPDTFPANKICAVKLRYFKDDMNASTSVYFNVKAHEVPFVKIVKVFYDDAKIKFIAVVRSPLPDLKIEWSCKQVDEEGNLLDFDLERLAVVRTSLIVKKRPNKLVIKRRVALVFRRLEDGLNVKCKCKVSREEVEAFAEEEMKVDVPPIEGKCHELERSEDGRISIEAVDFEDPAGEVLKYRVGYLSREGKPQFTTSWSIISAWENLDLPSGDPDNGDVLKCVVLARNTREATTRTVCPVVVPPQNFSKEQIKNTTDEISEKLNQNKIAEVRASVNKMLSGSNDKEANEEMLSELTKQMADQFKAIVENEDELEDREDINENLETLKLGLYGEEDENEQSREDVGKRAQAAGDVEELAKNVRKMASPQRKESDGLARRRRRAADGDNGGEEGEEVEAKTPDEVETILSIFDALIQASNYSNTTVKQELVLLVDDLGRGLCQSLSIGEPALVAESHIVVIRSEKNSFDTVDVNFTNTACENCSYTVQASAQVLLGQSLKDRYETWDCDEDGCNGACIVSAQYPSDLLAVSNNESSISDVAYVKLFNPENAAPLSANGLAEPATFRIPLRSYNASNDTVAMCHAWDESSLSWKTDGVATTVIRDNGNGGVSVDCKASSLGFVTVLAVDSSVLPLQSSTTQSPTVSTQHVAPENEVHIQFKLVGNYKDVITDSSKPEFISRVTQAIADAMGVQTSRLTNVDARPGSILVSFTLLPGGPGENNVSTAVSVLRELVTSGNFSVSLADGRTLVADSVSFQSSANPFSPVTSLSSAPTTQEEEEPSETSSKLNTGALFGIIVGSIVGVTLLIASVILFANMRSRFSKVDYASGKEKEIKPAFSPTSAHDNKVVYEELSKDEKKINSYPMINLREEADIPLPGTPCYPEDEKKCD